MKKLRFGLTGLLLLILLALMCLILLGNYLLELAFPLDLAAVPRDVEAQLAQATAKAEPIYKQLQGKALGEVMVYLVQTVGDSRGYFICYLRHPFLQDRARFASLIPLGPLEGGESERFTLETQGLLLRYSGVYDAGADSLSLHWQPRPLLLVLAALLLLFLTGLLLCGIQRCRKKKQAAAYRRDWYERNYKGHSKS